ncbi:MAG: zinc ABC transporter substrate-binding protein, partial [Odoribacter sp.]|nr:zinc ABC transporter substrate-binding protein [Odoribacter sp.]
MLKLKYFYLIALLCCSNIALHSCKGKKESKRLVTVSVLPQKYFVEKIAGDYVQVNVMIPPGMNPATCDLNTGLLQKLYDSDVCFTIGHLPFEQTHLYPVLENKKGIRVVNHSENLELLHGSCNHSPHEG